MVRILEKEPFRKYNLDEKSKYDAFTIWLNDTERKELEFSKSLLQQPKDSTALKALAHIGYLKLIGKDSTAWILAIVAKNSYNNKKTGVVVESPKQEDSNGNPAENLTDS